MRKALCALIDVKSIVTIALIGVFCFLAVAGKVDESNYMMVVSAVITYFFTKRKDTEPKE